MNVIETSGLGKRYGSNWALRECSLTIPAGHVAALVGPNGAGKTTLLNLAAGLAKPTAGEVTVLGGLAPGSPCALDGIAFVAQDMPLYKNLSAEHLLHLTRSLNRSFDRTSAERRLGELGIPLKRKAGKLSGGQQAQLALTLALARRPRLLVLDEPVAMLDPLARHDFMATVLTAAADDGVSVLLSSHVLAELERVADYLILMSHGRVQVAGETDDLLASHCVLTGPAAEAGRFRTAVCGAYPARRNPGPPAGQNQRNGRPGAARLGGPSGQPGRTCPGLSARARRRGAARPGPRQAPRTVGGNEMTALTEHARPEHDASLRPVPWRRMAWVTWRQHHMALAGVAAFLGVLAVWVWRAGLGLHHAYAAATACHPASSFACGDLVSRFNGMDGFLAPGWALQAVPVLIGAFAGAPVLARELETGTFRYAWTQGFGRWRWTLAKLVLLAVMVAAAAGVFSVLLSWYYQPYFAAGNQNLGLSQSSPLAGGLFDLRGVTFAAWTLAAFAIGALAGMLVRRVVPAIAATLAIYAGLSIAAGHVSAPALPDAAGH